MTKATSKSTGNGAQCSMQSEYFSLSSRDEVIRFEELLESYSSDRAQMPLRHISLLEAYDRLINIKDGARLFSALLDIRINIALLYLDTHAVGATWNAFFSKGKLEGGSVLEAENKFFGKMDIHRFNSSFVLRYRAIWDKIMGLIVLLNCPDEYERFSSARSRKKVFAKIASTHGLLDAETILTLSKLLTEFDRKFRTPEAHGTGALRKYSFLMESLANNPQIELIEYWNVVNSFLADLGKTMPIALEHAKDI